ncbi:hypothetical protein P152DRAFT_502378 [Eremomyces bilateralis CBS 781.70]|uniref:t-SNARE coiled-coil homology domain-containing protein n=1 Tax=Eremomyces bilateralis CBS 781.70 TaxID=1392243 RepID=A0A6G1G5N0_9PEZI|nr:uncharacterized protein P152DRAFT_502378 [Eremomyces bilateralis CBS 781.70]KAF1813246.1 hypothetical protein P152DRAFT_502378 [Eremomyces bilateralis CBS 781.70]
MDISPIFNAALKQHSTPPISPKPLDLSRIDKFLKEAYAINAQISKLHAYLQQIRPSYLALPLHQTHRAARRPSLSSSLSTLSSSTTLTPPPPTSATTPLTAPERHQIDASTSTLLRNLASSITALSTAVTTHLDSSVTSTQKNAVARTLERWAAGGARSEEEVAEETQGRQRREFWEGVAADLRGRLRRVGEVQGGMVEVWVERERERARSLWGKGGAGGRVGGGIGGRVGGKGMGKEEMEFFRGVGGAASAEEVEEGESQRRELEGQMSQEELQMLQEEEDLILKQAERDMEQIRQTQQSMVTIAELNTQLATEISVQADHISQLQEDAMDTAVNVDRGTKELKRASERKSTAQMVFWATGAFCSTMIVWDLIT